MNEVATFVSTPIPTTAATVTRNADVLTYDFAGNALASAGTTYSEVAVLQGTGSAIGSTTSYAIAFGVEAPQGIAAGAAPTTYICRDGTTVVSKSGLTSAFGSVQKRANSWGATGQNVTGNGAAPANGAFDGDAGSTGIGIGCTPGGTNQWWGTVKNARIWQRQLADSVLQSLTA
jgi:hypothetical protein